MPRTTPLEHDYIGLASSPSTTLMEINKNSPEKIPSLSSPSSSLSSSSTHENENNNNNNNNLKETELRLGLPGSESPERKPASCGLVSLFGKDLEEKPIIIINNNNKNVGECGGVKRGFSDVGSCGKWALSVGNGSSSEADLSIGVKPKPNSGGANKPSSGPSQPGCGSTQSQPPTMKELVPNPNSLHDNKPPHQVSDHAIAPPAAKAQVVGWPPIRSFRKNSMASNSAKSNDEAEDKSGPGCLYIKVSMDGAPYLRKVDLKTCNNYMELSSALEKMFGCFTIGKCGSTRVPERNGLTESRLMDLLHGSEYVVTYEDKDGDWMLVGDVPWVMFIDTCRRLRIMKGSEAIGLAPRSMEKSKSRN